jgi:CBS domain-containing protein
VKVKPPTNEPLGSYLTPAFEHARVSDAMRAGVITCPPDTSLKAVARMMATYHIHSVVVRGADFERAGSEESWGIVSDLDMVAAGADADERTAASACATEVVTVKPDETLERAAQLMTEHDLAHLVVVDPSTKDPIGILSTLDIAGVVAWGRA